MFHLNSDPTLKKSFFRPNVNTVYKGEFSLRWFGPIVWDSMLPESFKTISTLEKFKRKLKNGFLKIALVVCAKNISKAWVL